MTSHHPVYENRYLALGDSFTEGVGDPDAARPNGVRGWADRVAEQLILADPSWGYANLAVRGKKMGQVAAEQLDAAVALAPTLVSLYAGANDILRPKVDIDAVVAVYDGVAGRLAATGARLVLFTGFDAVDSGVFGRTRGRTAIYNELVREVADKHGAVLVDYWRMREFSDWRFWGDDRMHMSSAGHILMAKRVLEVLQASHSVELPDLPEQPVLTRAQKARADAQWAREHLGPWVKRRLTGRSSGDLLTPKYPEYTQLGLGEQPG